MIYDLENMVFQMDFHILDCGQDTIRHHKPQKDPWGHIREPNGANCVAAH